MNGFLVPSGRCAVAILALGLGAGCMNEALERQTEQLRQQKEEIAKQRQEIEALLAGKQVQNQKQQDCNRAFRDYFDKAQVAADSEQKIALYRDGLKLCPDDEVAHYELGQIFAARGRSSEAEKEFEAALDTNPGFGDARRQLDLLRNK